MSTASSKQQAEQSAADEPTPKKVKLTSEDTAAANNNLDATSEQTNDNHQVVADKGIPTKAANGKAKQQLSHPSKEGNDKDHQVNNKAENVDDGALIDEEDDNDDDDDDDNDDEAQPDPKISGYLEEIGTIQNEIGILNEKASEEILKVEQKFNKLRKPHYEKRNELLRNIPHFWIQTLFNHPSISPMIDSDDDEDCLRYLIELDVEEFEDIKSGYRIKLRFAENPYFKNETIVKEFHMISGNEQIASSTPLEFRDTDEGTSLKENIKNEIEMFNNMQQQSNVPRSFFAWFQDSIESGTDEIAEIIKDQIWPNPLDFYLSEEQQGLNDTDDDEEEDDDDEEDEDEGDESNDDIQEEDGMERGEMNDIEDVDEELIEDLDDEEDKAAYDEYADESD